MFVVVLTRIEEISVLSIITIIISWITYVFELIIWTISLLCLSSWMKKFAEITKDIGPTQSVAMAASCLHLYARFQTGFGSYFLFIYSYLQFMWIFQLFLSFSMAMSGSLGIAKVCISVGYLIWSVAAIIQIVCLTFNMDDGYRSLRVLAKTVREDIRNMKPGMAKDKAKDLVQVTFLIFSLTVQELERAGPLTGMGLFTIERSTITSMFSMAVTYIIILAQFKISMQ